MTDPDIKDKSLLELADEYEEEQAMKQVEPVFRRGQKGQILKTLTNLETMFNLTPYAEQISFNEFTGEIVYKDEPITDYFINELRMHLDHRFGLKWSKDDIISVLNVLAREKSFHPLKDRIESKPWDGVERVEAMFIDYLGAEDNTYTREVAKRWLTGAVARVYSPGIKFEIVPILQGNQGIGKSTLARKLGGDYFADDLNDLKGSNKDEVQKLQGKFIIELPELASMHKNKVEEVKSFVSRQVDDFRAPYDRINEKHKRTFALIGTTNENEYLKDLTGNRRFYPIFLYQQPKLNVFQLGEAVVQQMLAEALTLYKEGQKIYFDPEKDKEIIEMAETYQESVQERTKLQDDIDNYLEMPVPDNWNTFRPEAKREYYVEYIKTGTTEENNQISKITAKEIFEVVLNSSAKDHNADSLYRKTKLYLDNLEDWEYKQVWISGKNDRGYERK